MTSAEKRRAQRRARHVAELLRQAYGDRVWKRRCDGLDELMLTILSQNTTDRNSHEAFRRLKARWPAWETALQAPTRQLAAAIACGGLANIKAGRMRSILQELRRQRGELSLEFLAGMPPAAAREYLLAFKGVGAKTVACVLLFAFGMPVLPVDTHVHRVALRLGLIGPKVSAETAHELLADIVPAELTYPFHMLMVEHGRRVCRARRPECPICVLRRICPTGRESRESAHVTHPLQARREYMRQ